MAYLFDIFSLQVYITSISSRPTELNGKKLPGSTHLALGHKDLFTLGDRSFRWEYPEGSAFIAGTPKGKKGTKVLSPKAKPPTPGKKDKKKSPGGESQITS